jgi:Beta-ketoacyl synthase, N-terminal domain
MSDLNLSIENWAAWMPAGAAAIPAASGKQEISSDSRISTLEPKIEFLLSNQRRRLSPLSRIVVDTYHRANENPTEGLQIPSIFCSTYGEHVRNTNLILDISANSDVSPTAFSLSVHNAVAGLISIFYGNEAPCLTMATNKKGVSVALFEAYSMLRETSQISLTIYDGPVHESYRNALPDSNDTAAITLILSPANLKKNRLHIERVATESGAKARSPFHEIIEIVKLLQGGEAQNQLVLGDWAWSLIKMERNAS